MNIRNFQSISEYLQSAPIAQSFLAYCYRDLPKQEGEKKSYENTYRFMYYLEHSQTYYDQARQAPLMIQPVLYFYGMGQLLKAYLLTECPDYPENSSVLAHGVSTRKRKKQQYSFLEDEVKIQQKGLFPSVAKHLFHVEQFPMEKLPMHDLLNRIPEMEPLFQLSKGKNNTYFLGKVTATEWSIPNTILDDYNWTLSYFEKGMKRASSLIQRIEENSNHIRIYLNKPLDDLNHPFFYYDHHNEGYAIPQNRQLFHPFPEILCHYLMLYNLSMICRYETEWWGEQLHSFSSEDIIFIKSFLRITEQKIPLLIAHGFHQKRT
ncbi:YaaC family protein [Pontibacillus salicampi]|uniref:YaaC family protein n=1 Tax=Pontibacillus salicampi TaxID=1449801 RepID=A0ABV6LU62_9BACI